ncbi:hypothetical protein NUH88_21075 [Nisaea acidiphila]|uniref:Uncharacterized protein n=1 Tax=Nisaea acidiphila TaxID=1862145 RepID=A0A9J7AU74_9PROT|nr:hypothetical protein [Nisaea acidiphila]UUX49868.1 hypothetical protein NUH88_21075 [Nisaea acidiphila]
MTDRDQFLIVNSRGGNGQNPNVLGLVDDNSGGVRPQLAVSTDGTIPKELDAVFWTRQPFADGWGWTIQTSYKDTNYHLSVSSWSSGVLCELTDVPWAIWRFTYSNRILTYDAATGIPYSLDTGQYPDVMIWDFVSSVNQTWGFAPYVSNNALLGEPPEVSLLS